VENVTVGLGKATAVPVELSAAGVGEKVEVVADTTGLNITGTNQESTFSKEVTELLPKGLNFSSILKFAAAARPEPRSGQYQIDGASASENVFIVDGQEVSDVLTGALDRNSNLPFSLVQETQVKTSGFEAEFGGATGGVINVVTRSGGNDLHGEFGLTLRSSKLEPIGGPVMQSISQNTTGPKWYSQRRDQYNETNPTATLLGPIWKNKVFFAVGYAPQIFKRTRTLNHPGDAETYHAKVRNEKVFGRLDAQPFTKLNLYSTYQWNPETDNGATPGFTGELTAPLCYQPNTQPCGAAYLDQTGGRLNSLNFTAGGAYVINNNLVATARISHYFLNNRLGTYGIPSYLTPRVFCDARLGTNGGPSHQPAWPDRFNCPTPMGQPAGTGGGSNNVGAAVAFYYDDNVRDQVDTDATYTFSLGGRHELKGGFQNNKTQNNVRYEDNDIVNLKYGVWSTNIPYGTVSWYKSVSSINILPAAGAVGFGRMTTYSLNSNSLGKNKALYVQDKWQPMRRLTLNLGLRGERERVPGFDASNPGIDFGWGDKLAPRIGAAYDLFGDGKTKISGFYGLFYDRYKLTMSRRTFGGESYHSVLFDIFPGDTLSTFSNREAVLGPGGAANLIPGGMCVAGQVAPLYGRVRCDLDTASSQPGAIAVEPIDPNLKAFQQREITFAFQRQLSKNYLFSARFSDKRVIHAVEDIGFPTMDSTACCNDYITGNPGEGQAADIAAEFGFTAPKAVRKYDALELRLDRRFANNYFFSANYTYSRLIGNYSGTASSDEEGRLEPNIERYFDSPAAGFTAQGGEDTGRLPTDRPHVFKAFGTYTLGWDRFGLWKNNSTDFQLFFTAQSGTVLTSFVQIDGVEQIVLYKRGDLGRTPALTQTDFAVRHSIKFGKEGKYDLKLEADVVNLFNEYAIQSTGRSNLSPLYQNGNMISSNNFTAISSPVQPDPMHQGQFIPNPTYAGLISLPTLTQCQTTGNYTPCWGAAYSALQTGGAPGILAAVQNGAAARNPYYEVPTSWQAKRTVRYGLRLLF